MTNLSIPDLQVWYLIGMGAWTMGFLILIGIIYGLGPDNVIRDSDALPLITLLWAFSLLLWPIGLIILISYLITIIIKYYITHRETK